MTEDALFEADVFFVCYMQGVLQPPGYLDFEGARRSGVFVCTGCLICLFVCEPRAVCVT